MSNSIEIDAMFWQLLAKLPDLQKIGETEWQPSTFISGPRHIRVRRGRIGSAEALSG